MDPQRTEMLARILARGSKSFSFASHFLPPESRFWAASLYAWCRRVDDAIDEIPADRQPEALQRLRVELASVYAGEPQDDPVLAAFQDLVQTRRIPRQYPAELLDGMEMDVLDTRYDDLDTLLLYCHRVAGVVGLMMVHALGVSDPRALLPAAHLGMAFQLTNICRDVEEDWHRQRRYLPADTLGVAVRHLDPRPARPLPRAESDALAASVRELLDLADTFYASADRGIHLLPWRSAIGIRAARWVYWAIGWKVRRRRYDVFAGRAWVRLPGKLLLAARALSSSLTEVPGRLFRSRRYDVPRITLRYPQDIVRDHQPLA